MKRLRLVAFATAAAVAAGTLAVQLGNTVIADADSSLQYEVKASAGRVNRLVTGSVVAAVQGVPAEPVHSFVWDGNGSLSIEGSAELVIDPITNTGKIEAGWTDEHGNWELQQQLFAPPDHPSGLRVGPSAATTELVVGDPITTDVYLHGDTTAGGPVLPTVFNLLATWGPAEVTLNGEPFINPFDGPAPLWAAHTMTTVGTRGDDGTVRTVDGEIFNPLVTPANGAVDYDDLEFHVVFHDAAGPSMTTNFPPPFSFFYHLVFEEVRVEITHGE